jgi:hypothetical protein
MKRCEAARIVAIARRLEPSGRRSLKKLALQGRVKRPGAGREKGYARGGGGSGLLEASKRTASGFVRKPGVTTVATTVVRDVRIAVGPINEARTAVAPSFVLRHEHDDRDLVFV